MTEAIDRLVKRTQAAPTSCAQVLACRSRPISERRFRSTLLKASPFLDRRKKFQASEKFLKRTSRRARTERRRLENQVALGGGLLGEVAATRGAVCDVMSRWNRSIGRLSFVEKQLRDHRFTEDAPMSDAP